MEKETGYTDLDGTRIYYEITGSGPTLVLIHGFSLDSRLWEPQVKTFSENYQVLYYDLRGFGKSDLPTGDSFSHSKDLKLLLDYFEISKAYILGLSLGGKVAIDFVLQYPEMADALIPVDSALGGYNLIEFGKSFEGVVELAFSSGIDKAKVLFGSLDIFKSASMIPDVANQLWNILTDYSGWHFVNENPAISLEPPAIQQLKNIDTPTLILVGEFDSAEFHEVSNLLHEQIKDSRKEVLSGVGHVSNLENPEQFNNMVLEFLTNF